MCRREQLSIATDASIGPVFFVIDVFARKRSLRSFVLRDLVLFIGQPRLQLGFFWVRICHRTFLMFDCAAWGVLLARACARIKLQQQIVHAFDVLGRMRKSRREQDRIRAVSDSGPAPVGTVVIESVGSFSRPGNMNAATRAAAGAG